jgi:hypothetical protein
MCYTNYRKRGKRKMRAEVNLIVTKEEFEEWRFAIATYDERYPEDVCDEEVREAILASDDYRDLVKDVKIKITD